MLNITEQRLYLINPEVGITVWFTSRVQRKEGGKDTDIHIEFQPGTFVDDIQTSTPHYAISKRLANAFHVGAITGFDVDVAEVEFSNELRGKSKIEVIKSRDFHLMTPTGQIQLRNIDEIVMWSGHEVSAAEWIDYGKPKGPFNPGMKQPPSKGLIVSERCLELLRKFAIKDCEIIALSELRDSLTPKLGIDDLAHQGKTEEIIKLIEANEVSVNAEASKFGETILECVADYNQIETARALIRHGANVNLISKSGGTPLISASRNGYIEMALLLISNGANVNINSPRRGNALSNAISNGKNPELTKFLLEQGADINLPDENDNTPLINAAFWDQSDTVKLLLEKGADPTYTKSDGKTALWFAKHSGRTEIIDLIESYLRK